MLSPRGPTSRSLMMRTMRRMWWGCRRTIRPASRSLMRHWPTWRWRMTRPTTDGSVRKFSSLVSKCYPSIKIWNIVSSKRWREGTGTTNTNISSRKRTYTSVSHRWVRQSLRADRALFASVLFEWILPSKISYINVLVRRKIFPSQTVIPRQNCFFELTLLVLFFRSFGEPSSLVSCVFTIFFFFLLLSNLRRLFS